MANEGTINSQITDSVAQAATAIIGNAPSQTTGMLDAVMAETIGMAMYNNVTTQHNSQMVASAAIAAACARMLKSPVALPSAVQLSTPIVQGTQPSPLQATANTQTVQVNGTSFQPGLSVDVFNAQGTQIGSLSGTQQLASITPTSFSMISNLFTTSGEYGIEVVNPDGGRSSRYVLTAQAQTPSITSATATAGANSGSYNVAVAGTNFEPNLTATVTNQAGQMVGTFTSIQPTQTAGNWKLTVTISPPSSPPSASSPPGPFSIQVTNPDGGQSNPYLFTVPSSSS